ncbi:MAG: PD40 domain-containing protein [Balneolaceae bacterium]|nr:PD40 domain-containing protein [Balneolaceae bacterium]
MIRVLLFITAALTLFSCDIVNIFGSDSDNILLFTGRFSEDDHYQIYIYNAQSGAIDKLTNEKQGVSFFDWSNKSKRIVYHTASNDHNTRYLKTISINGDFSKTLKNNDGDLIYGSYPHWSPDGNSITYQSGPGVYHGYISKDEIFMYNLKRKSETKLTDNFYWDFFPIWNSSGEKVYFNSDREGAFNLYSVDINTKEEEKITSEQLAFGFRWFDKPQNLIIYDSRDSLINGTDRWVNRLVDLNSMQSYKVPFAPHQEKPNFDYRILDYIDPTTVLLVERHKWNDEHGSTLYFWDTESGELSTILNASFIGMAKEIDLK